MNYPFQVRPTVETPYRPPIILPPPRPIEFLRYADTYGFTFIYTFSLFNAQARLNDPNPHNIHPSPIQVFRRKTAHLVSTDKSQTPWHLLREPLSRYDVERIWTRDRCIPYPMDIMWEALAAPHGGVLQRHYTWKGWTNMSEFGRQEWTATDILYPPGSTDIQPGQTGITPTSKGFHGFKQHLVQLEPSF
jgi:hypothetical protein